MELHCCCTISGNCAQVGCLQISPGIFASSVDISSSQKWVRSCFIQKRSVSLNAHSGVRTAWIPSLHSKKTRRRMLAEVNNGLQQQEGQPEECLEEEVHFIEGKLLSELSTWGIGGPAKYFYEFHDEAHLIAALRRKKTQPIGERSVGCVFRNPMSGHSAGTIIEQAGLKGVMLGGAKVSEMHANFLINVGSSSSTEMCALIELVKEQVRQELGIELEEEILYVPYN